MTYYTYIDSIEYHLNKYVSKKNYINNYVEIIYMIHKKIKLFTEIRSSIGDKVQFLDNSEKKEYT